MYDPRGRLAQIITNAAGDTTTTVRGWDPYDSLTSVTTTGAGDATATSMWWDPTLPVPQVLRLDHDSRVTDLIYGHNRTLAREVSTENSRVWPTTTSGPPSPPRPPSTWWSPIATTPTATPSTTGGLGFGYRGELHTDGLLHLRARDYQPATAMFLTTDPLDGIPGHTTLTNPLPLRPQQTPRLH